MNLHRQLCARAAAGTPVTVAVIGAGDCFATTMVA